MFEQWLKDNGYPAAADLTEKQRKHLESAWKDETKPPVPVAKPVEQKPEPESVDDKLAAYEAEAERIRAITEMTDTVAAENVRNPQKLKQLREIRDSAIEDKKMDLKSYQLALHRFDRAIGPMVITPREQAVTADVLEAAVCMTGGLQGIEKHYDEQTLDTAHKKFKGMGLLGVINHFARRNGWNGHDVKANWFQALKAASQPNDEMFAAVTGPSTYSLPNVFANVGNKFLRVSFMAVDQTWRTISAIRSFNDFKTATTLGLTGAFQYRKLPPSGEIKHATPGEIAYTNKADTYAIMLGIDRQSIINDDLGALTTASRRIGRGAALALNDTFWTIFLNNSTFFTAGNGNVSTGAGSALGTADGAAINAAEVKFASQTDPDGKPLAVMPKIMLVPPTLNNTAARWMGSQLLNGSTSGFGATNIFGGRYTIASSPYMENSSYTGNSSAAWYLLADPNDVPVIEVGFLNGNESPTVETDDMEFSMLGLVIRGYWDFGVSLQEFRGGVRSAGS